LDEFTEFEDNFDSVHPHPQRQPNIYDSGLFSKNNPVTKARGYS
jgi:hypothetical protein